MTEKRLISRKDFLNLLGIDGDILTKKNENEIWQSLEVPTDEATVKEYLRVAGRFIVECEHQHDGICLNDNHSARSSAQVRPRCSLVECPRL